MSKIQQKIIKPKNTEKKPTKSLVQTLRAMESRRRGRVVRNRRRFFVERSAGGPLASVFQVKHFWLSFT